MAHFAKLDNDNNVLEVHVVSNAELDINNEEASGVAFLVNWSGGYTNWKQTSYNAATNGFRKNYAGIGYEYDEARDAFIPPKPFESWLLNESTCLWEAPTSYPTDGEFYKWVEEDLNWQLLDKGSSN
jgi:hypothetical protein